MTHRYELHRNWLGSGGLVNWIMLNPSTADEYEDDQTIRKCVGFSKRWGYSGLVVTNLFTFRATWPDDLRDQVDRNYGVAIHEADRYLLKHANVADRVVAAWGTHGTINKRAKDVMERLLPDIDVWCLGKTKKGYPVHPLMVPYSAKLELWREKVCEGRSSVSRSGEGGRE